MTNFMDGGSVSTFTAQFIALGQAQNANSNNVKSRYIMLGLKNKKSFIGKVQKIMLFEGDDFTSDVYELLKKYSTPSQSHEGGFDVNISAFKNSDEFKADPERWGLLLNYPGGMTIEYKFAKGLCYANNINGQPVVDKLGNHVMKDSVSVFCQVDFYTPGENGTMVPHYIEPYSPSTQGQRIESKFFMTAVSQNDNDGIYVAPVQQPTAQPTQQAAAPQAAAQQPTQPTAPVQGNAAGAAPAMPF
jgi:hypothetical protein